MRITIMRMIAHNVLAGFSTNAAAGSAAATSPIRPIRDEKAVARSSPASTRSTDQPPPTFSTKPPISVQPGTVLPRGSLLDLSV